MTSPYKAVRLHDLIEFFPNVVPEDFYRVVSEIENNRTRVQVWHVTAVGTGVLRTFTRKLQDAWKELK